MSASMVATTLASTSPLHSRRGQRPSTSSTKRMQGALLAAPVADTLKSAGADGCCAGTVERTALWRALTPQMFRYGALCAALRAARAALSTMLRQQR